MQNNVKGFGFRGWMLMIYQFLANLAMVVFTNYPMNALADLYSPENPQLVSMIFTVAMVVGILIQLVLSANIGKVKSVKNLSIIIGVLIGQWFPRRKGTVMGLVTIAFPLGNALLSVFAGLPNGS